LQIYTKGNILLSNVASWENDSVAGSYGADLNNAAGTGNVTITNLPSTDAAMLPGFSYNHDRGVNIHTNGFVTLTNVNALYNQEDGIFVWQELNKGATLTNCRVDGNGTSFSIAGIYVNTVGPIVINGGHANYNGDYGVWVHNELAPDAAAKPVTISNFTANYNNGYGIRIESKGAIKLTNVTANYTGGTDTAISLDNHWLTAGITLSNVTASYNAHNVIHLLTPGAISLTNVTASYNSGTTMAAIYLDNRFFAAGMKLSNIIASYNNYMGIEIETYGTLSLTNITADYNSSLHGMYIDQTSPTAAYPTITITTGDFSFNGFDGVEISGRGAITLKDITGSYNTGNGAHLINVSGNVTLLASSTGGNTFSYNSGAYDGLRINTEGAVTLNKVTASYNSVASGVLLYSSVTYVGNVTINGGNFSYQNRGLLVHSKGTITVNDVVAEYNTNSGITLENTGDTTGAKGITIARTAVNYNGTGLDVYSYGLITVNKIDARGNTGIGVQLNNNFTATVYPNKGVTILSSNGVNNLSGNGNSGLYILSRGAISITGVTANSNGSRGIDLDEHTVSGGGKKVTLSKITTLYNALSGIWVDTQGGFAGSYITSNLNGLPTLWDGLSILAHNAAVTISNSVFMENRYFGIYVQYDSGSTALFTSTNNISIGNGSQNISVSR
jgi:hypothetical protein